MAPRKFSLPFRKSRSDRVFSYQPLSTELKQIRLLTLEPARSPRVECSIHHSSLFTPDSYETISYCWGDAESRGVIYVEGKAIDVPLSTEKALRRMRRPDEKRIAWIDAVCINQADSVERSQQVTIMADVYSNGEQNLVYLGDDDRSTTTAIKGIRHIIDVEIAEATKDGTRLADILYTSEGAKIWSSAKLSVEVDQQALAQFFAAPWFRRLWVLQESALARNSTCHIGDGIQINLSDVLLVADWLKYKSLGLNEVLRLSLGRMSASRLSAYSRLEHSLYGSGRFRVDLLNLLEDGQKFLCSDPRDKLFAMLGLIDWTNSNGIPAELRPDYTKDINEVMIAAATWIVMSRRPRVVDGLFESVLHKPKDDAFADVLPSWVPRFDQRRTLDKWPRRLRHYSEILYPRARITDTILVEGNDHPVLRCGGCSVDLVVQIHPVRIPPVQRRWDWNNFFDDYLAPLMAFFDKPSQHDRLCAITEILTAATWCDRRTITKAQLEACTALLERSCRLPRGFDEEPVSGCGQAVLDACQNRIVGITQQGRPALLPRTTAAGDVVVQAHETTRPFIFRPCGEYFKVVGQAYVYGIMDGEAVQEEMAGGKEVETFLVI